jgi:hypothetical protein
MQVSAGTITGSSGPIPAEMLTQSYINAIGASIRNSYRGDIFSTGSPLFKYKIQTQTIKLKKQDEIPPGIEKSLVIQLGGSFQEIGGDYENVGGDYKKLG